MLPILVVTVLICFVINTPIAFSLGIASVASILFGGNAQQLLLVPQRIAASMNSFPLLAIPYFMIAGAVMERGGSFKENY